MAFRLLFSAILLPLALAAALLPASVARADAIDGTWCSADGRFLAIKGPIVVTPGGTPMQGNYERHSFSYVVPEAEPGAGGTVSLVLVNDDTVHLTPRPDAAAEVWLRCTGQTS